MKIIAHSLVKIQHEATCQIVLGEQLIAATDASATFLQQLRAAVTKHNPLAAKFSRPEQTKLAFEQKLTDYIPEQSDENFITLSSSAARLLALEMEQETATSGGYLVFAEHEHAGDQLLLIALLSTKARAQFDESLNLQSVDTLDVDHIRHAARIRLADVADNPDGVAHIVARSSDGLFFKKFLGVETVENSQIQANRLHRTLGSWADSKNYNKDRRESLYRRSYSYWKDCKANSFDMTLSGLANYLYPEAPDIFLAFVGNEGNNLAGTFSPPSSRAMRQFIKFAFDNSGIKLEFDRNQWGTKVKVSGTSVIIKHAPESLRDMIAEELG